ncbi:MAG: hypothetical protein HOM21_02760, partial [Halobacteriovoraceae bacterium]|nr:hypothetical protein [Halobacteriovoraceae bacterium]
MSKSKLAELNSFKITNEELEPDDVRKLFKERGLPENFCPVPFTTIICEPDGQVGICRLKGSNFHAGMIQDNSLEEIWNNEFMQNWRQEFLSGNVVTCEREIRHRGCNLCSENNKMLPLIDLDKIQSKPPVKFTANFNGWCNLECVMCHVWKKPNGLYDEINFWEKAETEIFPFVVEMDLLSGEPFLQKDTWRLIDMVAPVNPDCLWTFTTNCAYKLNDKMKGYLDKIKIKNFIISIDSWDADNFAEIRLKGNLGQVLQTASDFADYNKSRVERGLSDMGFVVNYLTQQGTTEQMGNFLDYCKKMNFRPSPIYA